MKKILPLILIFSFCSQTNESSNTVVLNYNEKLLAIETAWLGDSLKFQVPLGWTLADSSFTRLIDSTIYQNSGMVNKIFQDLTNESFLVCLDNPPYQLKQDSMDFKNGKWAGLQYSDFAYNDLLFDQTVLQNETLVLFKLNIKNSFNTPPISAIHFFIPRNTINSHARMVESSIASINK